MGLNSSRPYGFLLIFVVSFSLSGYWALCFLVGVLFFPFPSKVVGWRGLTFIVGERIEILWNGGLRSVYIRVCL